MKFKDKPYILYVAEKIYLEISKIETLNNKLDLDRMTALKNSSSFNKSTYDRLRNLNDILLSKEKAAKSEVNITSNLKKIAIYDGKFSKSLFFIQCPKIIIMPTR